MRRYRSYNKYDETYSPFPYTT
ncbi:BA14K family protein [Bacillus thuringiensis serovar kurstaki]|nr:BA14K family protein [Bacillus cereus]MCC2542252.1 BA14K family protein [Bacillus thuringiensis]MCC3978491.1 BA14K family protein [Bacillus thuringiensis serovar kurstaki]MCC3685865.1 BA14K family protein [Bacillus cereus]MCC3915654.1 BA14K family protein [Bacillus thuringiensis]